MGSSDREEDSMRVTADDQTATVTPNWISAEGCDRTVVTGYIADG